MKKERVSTQKKRWRFPVREIACVIFTAVLFWGSFAIVRNIKELEQYAQTVQLIIEPEVSAADAREMIAERDSLDMEYEDLFVCQAKDTEEIQMNRASVVSYSEKSPAYLAEEFASRWCGGKYVDLELILFLLKGLVCVAYAVLLCAMFPGIRKRTGIVSGACRWCSVGCCAVMFLKHIFVPRDYLTDIASKTFWKGLTESKIANFEWFLMMEKSVPDLTFLEDGILVPVLVIAVCGAVCMQRAVDSRADRVGLK